MAYQIPHVRFGKDLASKSGGKWWYEQIADAKYVQAMLGTLGMVVPELLDQTDNVPWFDAGAKIFSSKGIQYLGVPGLINAKNIVATLIVQVSAFFSFE